MSIKINKIPKSSVENKDAFQELVNKPKSNYAWKRCWEWKGGVNSKGYGVFYIDGKGYLAHRLSYYWYKHSNNSSISNKIVLHTCDNPLCVNPNHLEIGTQADNLYDAYGKGRLPQWENNKYGAKLTEEQVKKIYDLAHNSKLTYKEIAKLYNVFHTTIGRIKRGTRWGEVTGGGDN